MVRRELVVHTTTTEVDEEDAINIQSVFAALVDDERRTAQICTDVHTAVASAVRTAAEASSRVATSDAATAHA